MAKSIAKKPTVILGSEKDRTVRNSDLFRADLSTAVDTSVGVSIVRTREMWRAAEDAHEWALQRNWNVSMWTILTGSQELVSTKNGGSIDTIGLLDTVAKGAAAKDVTTIKMDAAFDKFLSAEAESLFIMFAPEHTFTLPPVQQYVRVVNRHAIEHAKRILMICPEATKFPPEIEGEFHVIDFKPPSWAELIDTYHAVIEQIDEDARPGFTEDEIAILAQNALGMSSNEFEAAIVRACVEHRDRLKAGEPVPMDDFLPAIRQVKTDIIRKTDLLDLSLPEDMKNVGGLDLLKKYIATRAACFSDEAAAFGIDHPKGMLLVGPPGTGKSLVAKVIAKELNVPMLTFNIGKVFNSLVGQSEQRMRQALSMIAAMAPVVVFMDEIDKQLGGMNGGGGDSGVSNRVFGTLLTWMQERYEAKAPVYFVFTANDVTRLPPELMRRGRLDAIFANTFPNEKERAEILKIHLGKRGHADDLSELDLRAVAKETLDFVGAELESIIVEGLVRAFNEGADKVGVEHLLAEAQGITPLSTAFAETVRRMNEWAKANARPASSGVTFDPPKDAPAKAAGGGLIKRKVGTRRIVSKPVRD